MIVYHCKPLVSDLFVEESRFDGKGFEIIAYIDAHFNPSGAVDSLGYIFDLIDIKQAPKESVVTLKARFSRVFALLKMGGISINASLQVGFMLRSLCSAYQAIIQEFHLGRHSLSTASLQMVVEQCVSYDKDPWNGPVGRDGKPVHHPSAYTADSGNHEDPYAKVAAKPFSYHMNRWHKGVVQQKGWCLFCFNTSTSNPDHKMRECPILSKVGLKLKKLLPRDTASRVVTNGASASPSPAPTPSPAPGPSNNSEVTGSGSVLGAFTASTEPETYNSGDEYDYKGKWDGAMYRPGPKSNASAIYPESSPSCCHVCDNNSLKDPNLTPNMGGSHSSQNMGGIQHRSHAPTFPSVSCSTSHPTQLEPRGVRTVCLPKKVLALLSNPPAHSVAPSVALHRTRTSLLVADSGATDHMLPDKSAFISYSPVEGRRVRIGNNSFAPILGHGTAIISLNGKKILMRNCLHVPDLHHPLYSLRAHQRQRGCGFIGMYSLGM